MFADAREIENGTTLRTDICVVGAGAAGITLALKFMQSGHDVVVLESGGLEQEPETQGLYAGDIVGMSVPPLTGCRLRVLGGSTQHWGGVIGPLDPIDFEARTWVSHSGWPFGLEELEPYYREAHGVLDAEPDVYDPESWATGKRHPLLQSGPRLRTEVWQSTAPPRFGWMYRQQLADAQTVQVWLHANAVSLETSRDGRQIRTVAAATLSGRHFNVRARRYVLACGGIENARLLLASQSRSPQGVANENGMVGRFFSGHPRIDRVVGGFLFNPDGCPELFRKLVSPSCPHGVTGLLAVSPELQREEELLNTAFRISVHPTDDADGVFERALSSVTAALAGKQGVPRLAISVRSRSETVPNPESRVLLGTDMDALGMPRVKVDWRLTAQDRVSLSRCTRVLAEEIGRLGLGRLRREPGFEEDTDWPDGFFGSWHHMGTTRMGTDRRTSVVSANSRSYEVRNLYVAGSSVFPTYGWGTPTLTIVALALRLAEHLGASIPLKRSPAWPYAT